MTTIGELKIACGMYSTNLLKKKEVDKVFKSLSQYLFDLYSDQDKEVEFLNQVKVKKIMFLKVKSWERHGFCTVDSNYTVIRLTEKSIDILKLALEDFDVFLKRYKKYVEYLQKKAGVLKEEIAILQETLNYFNHGIENQRVDVDVKES